MSIMKPFNKSELISILIIFAILIGVSVPNFISSFQRARDQARKDDMGAIVHALDEYYLDFGEFPKASIDGKILSCKKPGTEVTVNSTGRLEVNLIPCEWGKDSIVDLTPDSNKIYLRSLPKDPNLQKNGATYIYFSNGSRYQIYASLENKNWDEYDPKIVARQIMCGTKVCNSGRAFSRTRTDISIDEYEHTLLQK